MLIWLFGLKGLSKRIQENRSRVTNILKIINFQFLTDSYFMSDYQSVDHHQVQFLFENEIDLVWVKFKFVVKAK